MNPSKKKGTAWEVRLVAFLRQLHPRAERRAVAGTADKGDVAGIDGWVISAKNCKTVTLGAWLDDAEKQAKRAGVSRFAVVFPRRSHGTDKAFMVVPLWLGSELMLPDETGGPMVLGTPSTAGSDPQVATVFRSWRP